MAPCPFLPPGRQGRPHELGAGLKPVRSPRPTPHIPTHHHSSSVRPTSQFQTFDVSPRLLRMDHRAYAVLHTGADRIRRYDNHYCDRVRSDDQLCEAVEGRYTGFRRCGHGRADATALPSLEVVPVCAFGPTTTPHIHYLLGGQSPFIPYHQLSLI